MVPDREVGVVFLKGIGGAAEHGTDVEGVVEAGEEVSVVADGHREVHCDV